MMSSVSRELLSHLAVFSTLTALLVAGYSDFMTRTVKNRWPIIILLSGFLTEGEWFDKLIGLLLPFLMALLLGRMMKQKSGGADLKMYAAIGFNFGYFSFCKILLLACLFLLFVTTLLQKPYRRPVPLCTYLSAGAVFCQVFHLL